MNKILLLDGNSMLFRAYYGTIYRGPMMSKSGVVTNAVYGFSTMLHKAFEIMQPSHILVAFDTKDKTFRHEMFDDYKGTRPDLEPELVSQFELVREFLDAYPIKRIEVPGYEADDIIGTLSKKYPDAQIDILTSDQDMLQLISDNVNVVLMKKGLTNLEIMDKKRLKDSLGLRPDQIVDMKALMGDSSDNIPGVPSIGEKTALKLLDKYDTFENVYANKNDIKGKMGEKLREFESQARMSYELAKIFCDIDLDLSLEDFKYTKPDESLNVFYRKYDMDSLIVKDFNVEKEKIEEIEYVEIDRILDSEYISLINDENYYYLSNGIFVSKISVEDALKCDKFLDLISQKVLILLDSKFFYHTSLHHSVTTNTHEDVLLLAFIVDASINSVERLKDEYNFWFHEYNGSDLQGVQSLKLIDLFQKLKQKAENDQVWTIYEKIEKPLSPILANMEYQGINVDSSVLEDIAQKTSLILDDLTNKIYHYAEKEFNINSPKQLSEVLFDDLSLPQIKKRSTAVDVLEALEEKHPIISHVLEYRKYQKLYSTYAHGLSKYIHDHEKIHTKFNQTATQTGRLSSSDPNLQNISVRDPETREIRSAFVASENSYLVSIDYSQIELRVLSFLANEHKMIEAFNHNLDIHEETAKLIFHQEKVDPFMRRGAKSVNFGIVYGMSPYGLSKQLDIPVKEASAFIQRYNDAYPNIQTYMDDLIERCKTDGYVSTYFGRRRYIPEIFSSNRGTQSFGKRAAMNAPIQGTAADIIKLAMIKADKIIKANNFKSKLILQVHDELVFDVLESEMSFFIEAMVEMMENIVDWPVKLKVSVSYGKNWMEDLNA